MKASLIVRANSTFSHHLLRRSGVLHAALGWTEVCKVQEGARPQGVPGQEVQDVPSHLLEI